MLVALILLLTVGCGDGSSEGDLGVAEFSWDAGILNCLPFGCDLAEPVATEARAYISVVNHSELPPFTVSSSDPMIAVFDRDQSRPSKIRVIGVSVGDVKLELHDATSGKLIDRVTVRVRDVTSIEIAEADLFDQQYTIMVGGLDEINIDLFAGTQALEGIGGVLYGLADGLTDAEASLADATRDELAALFVGLREYVEIEALAEGEGALTVTAASGVSISIPVAIVGADVVTDVVVSIASSVLMGDERTVILRAVAFAGAEEVHSPECLWSVDMLVGPVQIGLPRRDRIAVSSSAPGSAIVTCEVGGAIDSRTVTFVAAVPG